MTAATRTVSLRPLERGDDERMARLFFRLSADTIYRRFMTHYSDPHPLRPLLDVDGTNRSAVVAENADGEIVGVARYSRLPDEPSIAEIAVVVQDDMQGHGIGGQLMQELFRTARANGVRRFTGTMLADNDACARLMRRALPGVLMQTSGGETTLYAEL